MHTIELEKAVARYANLNPKSASSIVRALTEIISQTLTIGEKVIIPGFGSFILYHRPSRTITDPQRRGQKIVLLPTNVAKFRPGLELKKLTSQRISPNLPETELEEATPEPDQDEELTEVNSPVSPSSPPLEKIKRRNFLAARAVNIEFRDLSGLKVEKEVLALIDPEIAKRYQVAPIELESGKLTVAMVDPENINTIELLKKITQLDIRPVLSTSDEINSIIEQYTALQEEVEDVIKHSDLGISKKEIEEAEKENIEKEAAENAPTVRIVFSLLKRAVREKASDIHIEPQETNVIVRYRLDGILYKRVVLPKQIHPSILARLKIMANVKIDEQRLPQDGRFQIDVDQNQIDFRFSTMPCVNGEKAVLRILDKSQGILSLEEIGVTGNGFEILSKNIRKSHGMTLVTGPTGSGKTTTLYAVLDKLMSAKVNIVTLEDPVEYRIAEINQSQINADIGYSFASSLRTVVRQDPDIIMLGEIRDKETAEMAIHAALTGHIVLSTLHTNDAAGAIPRLIDMGIEPFLIASSVNTVVGQRLTRKICQHCREPYSVKDGELNEIQEEIKRMPEMVRQELRRQKLTFYKGRGCGACNNSGYKGRQGVFEVLDVSERIKDLLVARASSLKIQEQAIAEGMVTMLQDGILKAVAGITSIEEVWRVTRE